MKRNLVLLSLTLLGLVLAAAPASAQVAFQMSSLVRNVRVESSADGVGQVTLAATTAGTIKATSTISLDYATKLEAGTGVVTCSAVACATPANFTFATSGSVLTVTFVTDVAFAVGNAMVVSGVRLNANAAGLGTIIQATGTATVPAASSTTNPITFFIVNQVAVANVKQATTVTITAASGGILTCVASGTMTPASLPSATSFTVKVTENFNQALLSKFDEDGIGGTGAGANSVDTDVQMVFPNVPVGIKITLLQITTGSSGTLTLENPATGKNYAADPVLPAGQAIGQTSAAGAQTLTFDFAVGASSTTGANEVIVATFVASTAGTITPGAATVTAVVSLLGVKDLTAATPSAGTSPTVPRFVTAGTPPANQEGTGTVIGVSDCITDLLFPFVTTNFGFDTGIALANTSSDVDSTTGKSLFTSGGALAQAGTCRLTFFPSTGNGATAGASISATTTTIAAGGTFTGSASALFGANMSGYMLVVCNSQNVHGLAFLSQAFGTTTGTSTSYVALILPNPGVTARNPAGGTGAGENLNN